MEVVRKYFNDNAKMFEDSKAHASHILLDNEAKAKEVYELAKSGKKKLCFYLN